MIARKYEIVNDLKKLGYSEKEAYKAIRDVLNVISERLANGDEVRIKRFGNFSVNETQLHGFPGRGFKKGMRVRFRKSKTLKRMLEK